MTNKQIKYNPEEIAVWVSDSPEEIGELERKYGGPVEQGMWVLTMDTLRFLTEPVLKGKKTDTYLTLSALNGLYPDVNCDMVLVENTLCHCYEKGGEIIIDKND